MNSVIDLNKTCVVSVVRMAEETLGFRVIGQRENNEEVTEFFIDTVDGYLDEMGEELDCDEESFDAPLVDMLTDAGNRFLVHEVKESFNSSVEDCVGTFVFEGT